MLKNLQKDKKKKRVQKILKLIVKYRLSVIKSKELLRQFRPSDVKVFPRACLEVLHEDVEPPLEVFHEGVELPPEVLFEDVELSREVQLEGTEVPPEVLLDVNLEVLFEDVGPCPEVLESESLILQVLKGVNLDLEVFIGTDLDLVVLIENAELVLEVLKGVKIPLKAPKGTKLLPKVLQKLVPQTCLNLKLDRSQ